VRASRQSCDKKRWRRRSPEPKFARVVVKRAARPHLTVHGPAGTRIEQLSIQQVAELFGALQVWLHTEPTDMCKSFNTLSALVTEEMRRRSLPGRFLCHVARLSQLRSPAEERSETSLNRN
jgi:hypothetical protein